MPVKIFRIGRRAMKANVKTDESVSSAVERLAGRIRIVVVNKGIQKGKIVSLNLGFSLYATAKYRDMYSQDRGLEGKTSYFHPTRSTFSINLRFGQQS